MRPKINDKIFGESVIFLAIQLTNKYNIQNYYNNEAKAIYHAYLELCIQEKKNVSMTIIIII